MAGRDLEAFFASLPGNELSQHEVALRQALLDFMTARAPRSFPLTEWIDRRIGGEVETHRNEAGAVEIFQRGRTPPGLVQNRGGAAKGGGGAIQDVGRRREEFLASLDPNGFSPQEEALRDMIFEFLARWKHRDLATLQNLQADPAVRQKASFIPNGVPLKDWIEARIGGEVEFKPDGKGGDVIHLTPVARPFVTKKYEEIQRQQQHGGGKGFQPPNQGGGGLPPPPAQRPAAPGPPKPQNRDAFFASLPSNELSTQELNMRQAILDFLEGWPRQKPPGVYPTMSELGSDAKVRKAKEALLPSNVPLKEWIDRRIGGEVELRKQNNSEQIDVFIRGQAPPPKAPAPPGPGGRGPVPKAKTPGRPQPPAVSTEEATEAFLAKLPAEEHTDPEAELRQAIIDYLEANGRGPIPLADATKDSRVKQCRIAFLPPEVPLRAWIDRRIGGEVEVAKDAKGHFTIGLRGAADVVDEPEISQQSKEEFFESLPPDGFTADEEALREALLDFLSNWKGKEPPTLAGAGGDGKVKRFRPKVLPNGVPVTLRDWIDRRIGGEVEMEDGPAGQVFFGMRGQLQVPKKRPAEQPGGGGPPWKKGRGKDGR